MTTKADYGAALDTLCIQAGLPVGTPEYVFHPRRKWRLDRVWREQKVAVELHGGVWSGGRHTTGSGFTNDRAKMNEAQLAGWMVLEIVPEALESGKAIEWLARALAERMIEG